VSWRPSYRRGGETRLDSAAALRSSLLLARQTCSRTVISGTHRQQQASTLYVARMYYHLARRRRVHAGRCATRLENACSRSCSGVILRFATCLQARLTQRFVPVCFIGMLFICCASCCAVFDVC